MGILQVKNWGRTFHVFNFRAKSKTKVEMSLDDWYTNIMYFVQVKECSSKREEKGVSEGKQ